METMSSASAVALKKVHMFGKLGEEALAGVISVLEKRKYRANEELFRKGDPGQEMFIIEHGSIAIYEPNDEKPGEERPLRIFGVGETLGEMALIDFQPRSLSARTVQPTITWVLSGTEFRRLLQDHDVAVGVMAALNDRIRYTNDFLGEVREWVGRMASGQYQQTPHFFDEVHGWVQQVTKGEYEGIGAREGGYPDPSMAALAAEFARMATQVRAREDALRQEIAELKIEIDQTKRRRQVDEITESEFFQDIKTRAQELRRRER